ncbi:integrase core domain-containing protein [Shewanella waksmanii]|uniref:integrase core domain-containing protein n=1 Tax=Shewanella waksmanii TaxID=213783 RepID=UPI000A06763D
MIAWRGKPKQIRVDNGPEFTSTALETWAMENNIKLEFIRPGSPYQNGFVERFNRSYREEVLDLYLFEAGFLRYQMNQRAKAQSCGCPLFSWVFPISD